MLVAGIKDGETTKRLWSLSWERRRRFSSGRDGRFGLSDGRSWLEEISTASQQQDEDQAEP
jgi:hypothetical protein